MIFSLKSQRRTTVVRFENMMFNLFAKELKLHETYCRLSSFTEWTVRIEDILFGDKKERNE